MAGWSGRENEMSKTNCACKRPNVANLDHSRGYGAESHQMVNRICLTCGTHWYGNAGVAVFVMPRAVWDGWMETAFAQEQVA